MRSSSVDAVVFVVVVVSRGLLEPSIRGRSRGCVLPLVVGVVDGAAVAAQVLELTVQVGRSDGVWARRANGLH
eukprot:7864525-Alexandrium_andersonii.AAC.1